MLNFSSEVATKCFLLTCKGFKMRDSLWQPIFYVLAHILAYALIFWGTIAYFTNHYWWAGGCWLISAAIFVWIMAINHLAKLKIAEDDAHRKYETSKLQNMRGEYAEPPPGWPATQ